MAKEVKNTIEKNGLGLDLGKRRLLMALAAGFWSFTKEKPLGGISAVVIFVLIIICIFATWLAPYGPKEAFVGGPHESPNSTFWLGTDTLGRDLMSRAFHGARISMYIGFISIFISTAIGTTVGVLTGYLEGKLDLLVQRVMDSIQAFPALILALGIIAVRGPGLNNVLLVASVILIPTTARIVRGTVLSTKQNVYVEASRALGASDFRIMFVHILPNVVAPIIVQASILLGAAILLEAALSFLGFGANIEDPSWGAMISGKEGSGVSEPTDFRNWPWIAAVPAVFMSLTVFSFNLLGDAIRDKLDPRLRGAGGRLA